MDWQDRVVRVLTADTSSLRELAILAGGDPRTFYMTADFSGVDISSLDMRGVRLPDTERTGTKSSNTRLAVRINVLIHNLLKAGNPGALSAHIEVLIRVYLDTVSEKEKLTRRLSRRLERTLVDKILSITIVKSRAPETVILAPGRRKFVYSVSDSIKARIETEAARLGVTQTELVRLAIYDRLLHDNIRSMSNYRNSILEEAIFLTIKSLGAESIIGKHSSLFFSDKTKLSFPLLGVSIASLDPWEEAFLLKLDIKSD